MDVVSTCPLPVASVLWQPRAGKWALTFVCKATYELAPTESALAREQEAPYEYDNYWNDDTTRSLYAASDLVPFKARADVILVGHAFAPRREPTRAIVALLMVGAMSKAVECSCDRMWTLDGQLREGARFTKIPLRYERAAGGPETTNPVGMRSDAADAYGVTYIPNLLPPGEPVPKRGEPVKPIGFGPIAPAWPSRVDRLGRHAASVLASSWNSQPLPEDLDPSYFNCAPADQQVAAIRPNERLVLENLHPEHPRLVTNLAGMAPVAVLERPGAGPEEVRLKCDTLWIDTDRGLCTLVWRGRVALDHPSQAGRVVVSLEGPSMSREARMQPSIPAWKELPPAITQMLERPNPGAAMSAPAAAGKAHQEEDVTYVASLDENDNVGVLPFVKPDGKSPVAMPSIQVKERPPSASDDDEADGWHNTTAVQASMPAAVAAALPFLSRQGQRAQPAAPKFEPPPPPSRPMDHNVPKPPSAPAIQAPPAPPPLIRPAPAMDPIAPAPSPQSPWAVAARGGPGMGSPVSMPSHVQPPITPEATLQGATFLTKPEPPSPTPLSPAAAAAAATAGAVAASNAAAKSARVSSPGASTSAPAAQAARSSVATRDVLTLLWYNPACVKLLPENKRWAEILEKPDEDDASKEKDGPKSEREPPNEKRLSGEEEGLVSDDDEEFDGFDEPEAPPPPPEEPPEVRDKKQVFKILARGEPKSASGIHQSVADAIGKDGTLEPPLVLSSGELLFPFDELETLKATVTAVSPLVAGDKKLKEVVDTVNELLKTPWLSRSSSVAEGLTGRIKEAFGQGNRMVPASYLESHTERILLEERHYQKRTVFGQTWLRTLFMPSGSTDPIPAYLPESLTKQLPMFQRMKARLIAEVHMQQDQYEVQPIALCVVALARVTALPQAPPGGK